MNRIKLATHHLYYNLAFCKYQTSLGNVRTQYSDILYDSEDIYSNVLNTYIVPPNGIYIVTGDIFLYSGEQPYAVTIPSNTNVK